MNRSKWPLVTGVVVVGALAGVALGGRPTTLPPVDIPASTSTPDTNASPDVPDTTAGG